MDTDESGFFCNFEAEIALYGPPGMQGGIKNERKLMQIKKIFTSFMLAAAAFSATGQNNVAEEVAWVVGDTPIWKSEIEEQLKNLRYENREIQGDPYCFIPEQMAIQKLFLHQAELDTIEANEGQVVNRAESQINYLISQLGSREKVEQYFHKSLPEIDRKSVV